jgi:hypothetical protein
MLVATWGTYPFVCAQADFAKGTYRATTSAIYRLAMDIVFQPDLNADGEHWPSCETDEKAAAYCKNGLLLPAYRLGFFAAITLEGSNVHLDLNGYKIEQSLLHSLKQRFFAVVETGSAPFVVGQGPGDFGRPVIGCSYCSVYGGRIGRSAHHGIHGVCNDDITITDIVFEDYEVAAISLNGPQRLLVDNTHARAHSSKVLSRATLSAARFLQRFVDIASSIPGVTLPASLTETSAHLQDLEDVFIGQFLPGGTELPPDHEARKLFDNFDTSDGKLVDGNAYGIVIHGFGVLVNQFGEVQPDTFIDDAQDVTIRNTKIHNVLARVNEVVTVQMPDTDEVQPMLDVAGSVLRIDEQNTDPFEGTGTFKVDALHQLRFEYAAFMADQPPEVQAVASGTLRIDDALSSAWVDGGDADVEAQLATYDKLCNSDSMFHAQKGVIGLFLQKVDGVRVSNVEIDNVRNHGPLGSTACGNYIESQWTGHTGYTGSQAYGMVVTTSRDVNIVGLSIDNVLSVNADAYGVAVFNDVDTFCSSDIDIGNVMTAADGGPNDPPRAFELLVEPHTPLQLHLAERENNG